MACNDNISNLCTDTVLSTCVDHEAPLGENSKITKDCVNQSDVNTDLYSITDDVINGLDTSNLGDLCLSYPPVLGKVLTRTVLEVHESKICEIDGKLEDLKNLKGLDISSWGIDFGCLIDDCSSPTKTLGQFIQNVSAAICEGVLPPVYSEVPGILSGEFSGSDLILTKSNLTTVTIDATPVFNNNTNLPRVETAQISGSTLSLIRGDSTQIQVSLAPLVQSSGIQGVQGGTNVTIDNSDPDSPIINVPNFTDTNDFINGSNLTGTILNITGTGLAGTSIDLESLSGDLPQNLSIAGQQLSISGGNTITLPTGMSGVNSIVAGTNVTVDNADPLNPVINSTGGGVSNLTKTSELINNGSDNTSTYVESDELSTVATTNDYNDLDNLPPTTSGLQSVVAGTNITIDSADPLNPIITSSGGTGGVTVDNAITDGSANPVTNNAIFDALELKANDNEVVKKFGPQTILDLKTFASNEVSVKNNGTGSGRAVVQFTTSGGGSYGNVGHFSNEIGLQNVTSNETLRLYDSGGIGFTGLTGSGTQMVTVNSSGTFSRQTIPTSGSLANLDLVPTNNSTEGVESNGIFDALTTKAGLSTPNTFTSTNFFNNLTIYEKPIVFERSVPARIFNSSELYVDSQDRWGFGAKRSSPYYTYMDFSDTSGDSVLKFTNYDITWNNRSVFGTLGDNLGNHIATQDLDINGNSVVNAVSYSARNTDLNTTCRIISNSDNSGSIENPAAQWPTKLKLYANSAAQLVSSSFNISALAGTGTRMVTAGSSGDLSTSPIPTNQTLSISGQTISLSNGGSVTVPSASNQTLSTSGRNISISGGNSIITPAQNLSLSGNTLSITSGNSVVLPSGSDPSGSDWDQVYNTTQLSVVVSAASQGDLLEVSNSTFTLIWVKTGKLITFSGTFPIYINGSIGADVRGGNFRIDNLPFSTSIPVALSLFGGAYEVSQSQNFYNLQRTSEARMNSNDITGYLTMNVKAGDTFFFSSPINFTCSGTIITT